MGEMAAAGVLMQANIQFNGALVLQAFGDGPVKLAVAEVQPDLAFRVTATVVDAVPADARLEAAGALLRLLRRSRAADRALAPSVDAELAAGFPRGYVHYLY